MANARTWLSIGGVVAVCLLIISLSGPRAGSLRETAPAPIVDFYGESLCPDCKHMVLDVLDPMFKSGVADLMTLKYIAYGKVKDGQCQHGATECKYNRFINCAQELYPDQNKWFPYVKCLAKDLPHIEDAAPGCAQQQGWKQEDLEACAEGSKGKALELAAGKATTALEPKLTNVPWVIINGVPLGKDFENLDRPKECTELTTRTRFQ